MSHFARRSTFIPIGIVLIAAASACGSKADKSDSAAVADSAAAAMGAAQTPVAPALNDAQIAHIVVTANSIDSAAGVVAKAKGQNKLVKDFGQTMITDHSGVNAQAIALATKLGVTPEDNATSQQLSAGAAGSATTLQGLSDTNFDRAYVAREIAYHEAVLDALDKTLIPGAQNAELKELMVKVRPAFVAHLDHARELQKSIGTP